MTPNTRRVSMVRRDPRRDGKQLRARLGKGCDTLAGSRLLAARIRERTRAR